MRSARRGHADAVSFGSWGLSCNGGNAGAEVFESVPVDPFDGKPLRFKKKGDGAVVIYSIGRDVLIVREKRGK